MATYLLRDVDAKLWEQFRARAESEGRNLRWILIEMIRRYVKEGL